jgi:hypothetical protein
VTRYGATAGVLRRIHTYHAVPLPRPCHYPSILRECSVSHWPLHEIGVLLINFLKLGVASHPAAATLPRTCHEPAMALRGRFQKGKFVAWQENGIACVNQTRPHCVNQTGNTQSKALVERHGRGTAGKQQRNGTVCVNPPLRDSGPLINISLQPMRSL